MIDGSDVHVTIVVPTYERRDVLLRMMQALARIERPWDCELVVVVDGSQDGSAEAARALPMPFATRVFWQENAGAAAARNAGARAARGRYLLFLDDDMIAAPDLLVRHDDVLAAGADAVVGHIPVHPDSPHSLLTRGLERWTRLRHERLLRSTGSLTLGDLITGQLSVRRELFLAAGAFDEEFNRRGQFGAEDTDFLYRLLQYGADVRYAPDAVSAQLYVVQPEKYLRQWRQAGRSDAALIRKHPEIARDLLAGHYGEAARGKLLRFVGRLMPGPTLERAGRTVARRARSENAGWLTQMAFAGLRDLHYWRGHSEAAPPNQLVVLALHAVDSIDDVPVSRYAITVEQLDSHLTALTELGVRWATGQQLLRWLAGERIPGWWVLLTFDDAYACLLPNALPLLQRHGATAMVLPVTGRIGGVNAWDVEVGAQAQSLLPASGLAQLIDMGWSIGSHTRTHAHLTQLSWPSLHEELVGAIDDLSGLGLPSLPVVAYPYGEHDARVRSAVRRAGYVAGLSLDGGRRCRGMSAFAVPRIEVTAGTTPKRLVELVRRHPHRSVALVEREARLLVRTVLRWSRGGRLARWGEPSADHESTSRRSAGHGG